MLYSQQDVCFRVRRLNLVDFVAGISGALPSPLNKSLEIQEPMRPFIFTDDAGIRTRARQAFLVRFPVTLARVVSQSRARVPLL